jgi:hypothetical protein
MFLQLLRFGLLGALRRGASKDARKLFRHFVDDMADGLGVTDSRCISPAPGHHYI